MDRKPLATIVLVEDDAEILEPLSETLYGEGFDVLPAANAEDALRLCRTNVPDLMGVDLTMPAESGIDLVRKIKASDRVRVRLDPNLPSSASDPWLRIRTRRTRNSRSTTCCCDPSSTRS